MSFSLRKLEAEGGRKVHTGGRARREKHGVKAFLNSGRLPSGRSWEREQAQIAAWEAAMIKKYGGDKIEPDVLACIQSAAQAKTISALSMLYVKKSGVMRQDSLQRGHLELHAVLSAQFCTYQNVVRNSLEAAARLAKSVPEEEAFDVTNYVREFDKRATEEAKVKDAANTTDRDKEQEIEGKDGES
jgi:hypothetical protein